MGLKHFYDTEFIDDGRTVDLISIGIVCEDGTYYYAVSSEFDQSKLLATPWLVDNVWPHLPLRDNQVGGLELNPTSIWVKDRATIAQEVWEFLTMGGRDTPELWAWYDAHDFIALTQLWGPLHQIPDLLPKCGRDLKQEFDRQGQRWKPPTDGSEHNALADARWDRQVAELLGII
jgi:hypothetical protein